jgi:DNA end-binding protein Ku
MASRPIASGTISFGLVAIPVKLYTPIDSSSGTIRFNQIHGECGTRLKQQMHCPTCEKVVSREEIVKGYEYAKNQYTLFSEEELEALLVKPTQAIEISEFVPLDQVDPIYFEKSYYLGPDRGGEKPYRLLAQTMLETGRAALARYSARGKQYLVLVRPFAEGLIMQQLYYAREIRSFADVPLGDGEVKPAELELARQLIAQTSSEEFRPEAYEDQTRKEILALIERKIQGEEVTTTPAESPKAQVIDLMEALKASLASSEGSQSRKPPKAATRKPEKAAAAR